jgi:hypothetical protein
MGSDITRRKFCRKLLLTTGAAGICAGTNAARADQSFKMSKLDAGYTLRDKRASQICDQCLYFMVPDECMIVEGKVSPFGWCLYYYD